MDLCVAHGSATRAADWSHLPRAYLATSSTIWGCLQFVRTVEGLATFVPWNAAAGYLSSLRRGNAELK